MNRQQKTWIRLVLVMSSVVATFLGLQMFILVDLQKQQAVTPVMANTITDIAVADASSVAGDAPPPDVAPVATDPPTPELTITSTTRVTKPIGSTRS